MSRLLTSHMSTHPVACSGGAARQGWWKGHQKINGCPIMLPVLLTTNTFWDNAHWMLSAHTSNSNNGNI